METTKQQTEIEFRNYLKKMNSYRQAVGLLGWDSRTGAPKKGMIHRSEVIGTLSSELFQMSTSNEMANFLKELQQPEIFEGLSEVTKKSVEEMQKSYDKNMKIPKDEFKDFIVLRSKAENAWEEAKEKNDFSMFQPYLEKIVEFQKKFIGYRGYEGHPYNTLLDDYEPGVFVDTLDEVFGDLKEKLIPLVKGVTESKHQPKNDFLFAHFPKEKQRELSVAILKEIGFDFEAGRLDETVHPFAMGLNPGDVRVTTKYNESDFRVSLYGTIHEGGHALYEQNISEELVGTPLCGGTSMGIHESQSLFLEKFVGQNEKFLERNYSVIKKCSNGQFDDVTLEDFYFAVNEAKPSFIRIEADELTYCLHIILRYELEKALISGELEVKDLPDAWNDKMEEYLGIRPSHNGEGVLQDVHWSMGSFGYFPSYALGYIYAAQMKEEIIKDIPEYDELLLSGDNAKIRNWLTENVHKHGGMKKPAEIIKDITGGGINSEPLVNYLTEKYSRLYQL
ncbi:peptidase M32 [Alkalihalobacillus alcalophilus ATCC 27647 = CGMCC 1.3604]|uniref:Metal-dependent carboxypeptidase n=1 Tax=Alkalihalobacillus alcalophilus ATCC 27647 = CGMCC 1.3604 TaxID=1218173 RepID=A0A094WIK2_ALKAL|nr:carboxypeptidase M32 [Alkalihalobacillus alcalophilus]KGA96661.1 peptidase M32 [Alkalihalobacillus alcalophilus ATCC 27647 = CGMCC 1.3604]MED1561827.1 carboxypeptidase M32 [Alkalihalobacillus alcalophilus]THG90992.1 peptidase M32 [Alkalihalobacillus alcalophilus ATCC 27647 = CGMCC 1.3604]